MIGARFGGATITRSLFTESQKRALRAEAQDNWPAADRQETRADDLADGRAGQPARRLWSGPGGPVQDSLYCRADVLRKLSRLSGWRIRPSGGRGSYSYYVDERCYLGLHRDVPTCDLTTLTVVADTSTPNDPHGGLLCYPTRCDEPLSSIRNEPRRGASVAKVPLWSTLILAGGEVAHRLLPVAPGTSRVVSVLCFEAVEPLGGHPR